MQITIFGASGKVGQLVVAEALRRGFAVRAFVHVHNPFAETPELTVVRGSLDDAVSIKQALQGSDAVISTLGSWGTADKNTLSVGMAAVIPAMRAAGMVRLVTLTGAAARLPGERFTLVERYNRFAFGLVLGKILHDGDEHLRLLSQSELLWTSVRSPAMLKRGRATYHLRQHGGGPLRTIPRRAVAASLLDLAASEQFAGQAPHIRR